MADHRAARHSASRAGSNGSRVDPSGAPSAAGKRKAVKPSRTGRTRPTALQTVHTSTPSPVAVTAPGRRVAPGARVGTRKPLFPLLPSAPTAVGAAALVIAAAGALTAGGNPGEVTVAKESKVFTQASALTGTSAVFSRGSLDSRTAAVSRDSEREALEDAAAEELQEVVEAQAEERSVALAQLAASAEKYAGQIAANAWRLPVSGYRLTATFGSSSGLWASSHTGLDFAAPSGTPVVSVANGTVRSTEYAGAYGNRVIVALEDGTEIWYCHLSSFTVSAGESVAGGEQVGTVGSTGNSTGSHLHLEVRPGAGDAVDPYAALLAHGVNP